LLALAPTYLVFWGLVFWISRKEFKAILKHFLLLSSLFCLITFLAGSWFWSPPLRKVLKKVHKPTPVFAQATATKPTATPTITPQVLLGGTESQTIRNIVWKGAVDIWKNYPLFGSGVETFAYSYYNFRPVEHNLVSEWDFLYNKAHNEYLNLAATTGTFGLLATLGLIGVFLSWSVKRILSFKELNIANALTISLLAGYISILITNFFGFSVVPVALQFFLYPAMAMVIANQQQTTNNKQLVKKSAKLDWWQTALIVFCFLSSVFCLLRLAQFWYADVLYAKGIKLRRQGKQQQSFQVLQQAISLNSNEPVIRTEYGYSAALMAMAAHQEKQDKMADQMIELALNQSGRALEISPRNVNLWKDKVKIYYLFSEINPEYFDQARQALLQAIELAPTDAKLWYNLGVLYTKLDQEKEAIEVLEKSVEMKENYQAARYALALLYQESGQRKKAIEQTEYILTYINPSVSEIRELYRNLTGREFKAK
jgi:tetratricopeptide (TPR) repeat protein